MTLASKTFGELITFTRASTKMVPDSLGNLTAIAAGVAATVYDAHTLDKRGFSIEEQRTNLLLNSDGLLTQLDSRNGVSQAATPLAAYFNNSIQFPAASGLSVYAYKTFLSTAGATYSLSVFVRMDDGSMPNPSVNAGTGDLCLVIDGNVQATSSYTISALSGGVYRISMTYTVPTARSSFYGVVSYASQTQKGFRVTGYQLEAGAFATSYIPTTTAQVTRAADSAIVSNVAMWLNPVEGTLYAELIVPSHIGNAAGIFALHDGTIGNRMTAYFSAGAVRVLASVGGVNQTFSLGAIPGAGSILKVAFTYKASDFAGSMNGSAAVTSSSALVPGVNAFRIGGTNYGAGSEALNGQVRSIRYIPRRLSNAELQALTAKADPGFTLDFNFDAKTYYMGLS